MEKLKLKKQYSRGVDVREFEKTDLYCIKCGEKKVYQETGDGDYYLGASYYCKSCKHEFYAP